MAIENKPKTELHPRNRHRDNYDFDALIEADGALKPFVGVNKFGNTSINFFDPKAVVALNRALLKLHYKIEWWEIPDSALTPPIPGRADYIHYAAELLGYPSSVHALDIGVGASCIYPIIGCAEYGWKFTGSDISQNSLDSSAEIIMRNSILNGNIKLRLQGNPNNIFEGIIAPNDHFDITICNPPFHDSAQSAMRGTKRKLNGLKRNTNKNVELNFSGQGNELWCEGGERRFIETMINESRQFAQQCRWFTSLVSNEDNLPALRAAIRRANAKEYTTINMYQGNKKSRILAWRY